METLIAGYRRFRARGWPEQCRLFESLAENGQSPKALVVACVDSRVDPAMIFDAAPGELLTVRNVANLVPPYAPDAAYHGTSAALEFGVRVLEVPRIMVLGHGLCGGVQSLLESGEGVQGEAHDFIEHWMSIAEPARARAVQCGSAAERRLCCEYEVVRISLAHLMTFPWIAERVRAGKLALHGAWFNIHSGALLILQPDGSFSGEL
jgi:carbonic anhydrase